MSIFYISCLKKLYFEKVFLMMHVYVCNIEAIFLLSSSL